MRDCALKNPEAIVIKGGSVFTMDIEDNVNDYLVRFILNFLEACCMNEDLTLIICRVLLNHIFHKIQEDQLIYSNKHQEIALTKIENIRTEMLFDYVNKMKLEHKVNPKFYKDITRKHLERAKFHEAALLIHKFKFKDDFDCLMIIEKLAI